MIIIAMLLDFWNEIPDLPIWFYSIWFLLLVMRALIERGRP